MEYHDYGYQPDPLICDSCKKEFQVGLEKMTIVLSDMKEVLLCEKCVKYQDKSDPLDHLFCDACHKYINARSKKMTLIWREELLVCKDCYAKLTKTAMSSEYKEDMYFISKTIKELENDNFIDKGGSNRARSLLALRKSLC